MGEVVWRVTLRLAWPAALAAFLILFVRAVPSLKKGDTIANIGVVKP